MFDWFKKNSKAEHPSDPMTEKIAATAKEQEEIADLQSQLAQQKANRNKAYDDLLKYEVNREKAAEEYRNTSSPTKKDMLLNQVRDMDEDAKGIHQTLTIAQDNIKTIRKTLREKFNIKTADEGDVGKTIDLEKHAQDLANAGRRVADTKIKRDMASGANEDLVANFNSGNKGQLPEIPAMESDGKATQTPAQAAGLPATLPPPPSMFESPC